MKALTGALLAVAVGCVMATTASAQDPAFGEPLADYDPARPPGTTEFSLGVGYAYIRIGDEELDSENALRFDPALSISPIPNLPQLRLGVAVGVSLVLDDSRRTFISSDGGLVAGGQSDIPLWLIEPELRLSWRQYFGDQNEFFIEPGVAGGGAFAFLDIEDDPETAINDAYDESDSALTGRVFLRAGIRAHGGFAGLEASYLRGGSVRLADNAAGELEQFYIGVFGALAF